MTTDGTTARYVPVLAMTSSLLFLAGPAAAAIADDPFADLTPVEHADLSHMRGGMMIGGMSVDFAVTVTTMVQGATQAPVGLQTTLAFNNSGGIGSSSTSSFGLPQNLASTGGLSLGLGNNATSIIQQVTQGQIQSLISNAANNMSITHATDITVTLPSFSSMNQLFAAHAQAANLGLQSALAGLGR